MVAFLEVLLRAAAPPLGAWGWGALEVDLDPRLGGRLADPLEGRPLAIRLPLGVGGLKELGDPGPCVLADLRRAGAGQLEAEVQLRHRSALLIRNRSRILDCGRDQPPVANRHDSHGIDWLARDPMRHVARLAAHRSSESTRCHPREPPYSPGRCCVRFHGRSSARAG